MSKLVKTLRDHGLGIAIDSNQGIEEHVAQLLTWTEEFLDHSYVPGVIDLLAHLLYVQSFVPSVMNISSQQINNIDRITLNGTVIDVVSQSDSVKHPYISIKFPKGGPLFWVGNLPINGESTRRNSLLVRGYQIDIENGSDFYNAFVSDFTDLGAIKSKVSDGNDLAQFGLQTKISQVISEGASVKNIGVKNVANKNIEVCGYKAEVSLNDYESTFFDLRVRRFDDNIPLPL